MNVVYNHDRTTSQNHAHSLRTRADTRSLWKFMNESAAQTRHLGIRSRIKMATASEL